METLIKQMKLAGLVVAKGYDLGWDIFDEVQKDNTCVVEFTNLDEWKQYNILNREDWVTYADCRHIVFTLEDDVLYAKVKVEGYKTTPFDTFRIKKWSAKIKLPISFIEKIRYEIEKKFDIFCEKSFEEYLEEEKMKWIKNFKKSLLE